jgi:hypothetical protein
VSLLWAGSGAELGCDVAPLLLRRAQVNLAVLKQLPRCICCTLQVVYRQFYKAAVQQLLSRTVKQLQRLLAQTGWCVPLTCMQVAAHE